MLPIKQDDIHLLARHSNWPAGEVERALKKNVYHQREDWQKFLRLFFLSAGIGFASAGIIFFLAYNWVGMHKFVKLGILAALIICTTLIAAYAKISETMKHIILTGAAILVGGFLALFGQIYQTGADAFDLFLGWTILITAWVIVAHFGALWLLYLTLINTTIFLYADQVSNEWTPVVTCTILFLVNGIFLVLFRWLSREKSQWKVPFWLTHILALASVSFATMGICIGIFNQEPAFYLLILLTIPVYAMGLYHALKSKSLFYLSIIPFSLIIMISALLMKISKEQFIFLVISLFISISVSFMIKMLLVFQKKWQDE